MKASYIHPAVGVIQRIEKMWCADDQVAYDRASHMVKQLIDQRLLKGDFLNEIPDGANLEARRVHFEVAAKPADDAA